MFPNTYDMPSILRQPGIGVRIPGSVGFYLLAPELGVALRPTRVFRTSMPEPAIHEDGYLQSREHDIRHTSWLRQYRVVHPVAQVSTMELTSQRHLSRGIALPHLGHSSTGAGRRAHGAQRESVTRLPAGGELGEVRFDASGDGPTQIDRNGITDQTT